MLQIVLYHNVTDCVVMLQILLYRNVTDSVVS